MDDASWTQVAMMRDVPDGGVKSVFPKGKSVLLLRRGEEVLAMSNRCPHMGCLLTGGKLEGDVIRCPCHEWAFNIRTGEMTLAREVRLPVYDVKVQDGRISLRLEV